MKNRFFWLILHSRYCFKTTTRLYRKMEGVQSKTGYHWVQRQNFVWV